eukprot:scaffold4880_cov106-Cylindrotheca_fusiformis.AAC.5
MAQEFTGGFHYGPGGEKVRRVSSVISKNKRRGNKHSWESFYELKSFFVSNGGISGKTALPREYGSFTG